MLYKVLKRMIEKGNYDSKEELMEKMDLLLLNNQITIDQFNELVAMLEQK